MVGAHFIVQKYNESFQCMHTSYKIFSCKAKKFSVYYETMEASRRVSTIYYKRGV